MALQKPIEPVPVKSKTPEPIPVSTATGTVYTPRYEFRYDGRWLMDGLAVSANDQGLARHCSGDKLSGFST